MRLQGTHLALVTFALAMVMPQPANYKGISAMYTGIAGALSGMALLYVAPASIFVSLSFLIGSAVGGIATLSGAIYGALFLHLLPGGIAGLVAAFPRWMRRRA